VQLIAENEILIVVAPSIFSYSKV